MSLTTFATHAWINKEEKEGSGISISGTGHTNSITQLVAHDDKIISIGMDDTVRLINDESKSFR